MSGHPANPNGDQIDVVIDARAAGTAMPALTGLARQRCAPRLHVRILLPRSGVRGPDEASAAQGRAFAQVRMVAENDLRDGTAPWVLRVRGELEPEPHSVDLLLEAAGRSPPDTAAFEARQLPFELPKPYDPVTLGTRWCSSALVLYRRACLDRLGGEARWGVGAASDQAMGTALRGRGFQLRYVPRAVTWDPAVREPPVDSPLSRFELGLRFGRSSDVVVGAAGSLVALLDPRRAGLPRGELLRQLLRLGAAVPALRKEPSRNLREGAFHPLSRPSERRSTPLASVLIRTTGRVELLRQAVSTAANQTWPNVEIVVVEDGPGRSEAAVREAAGATPLLYLATGSATGRCAAGNLALARAGGDWLTFLDDDDLLFADHLESLIDAAERRTLLAANALALAMPSRIRGSDVEDLPARARVLIRPPFSRRRLWLSNNLTIQSVVFHRDLYARRGGFDETLDRLEDWELWLRYSLETRFAFVPKLTSIYRLPADPVEDARRWRSLESHREEIAQRQRRLLEGLGGLPAWTLRGVLWEAALRSGALELFRAVPGARPAVRFVRGERARRKDPT